MYGQMTAGSWIYIGTQGILQGTYETFAAVAAKRFGGTLAGTLTLTAGCGGMGGAQPLAVTMNGGVCLIVDVDRGPAATAGSTTATSTSSPTTSTTRSAQALAAKRERRALSVGVVGNAADGLPRAAAPRRARSTSSPTRPARTTRCRYLPDGRRPRRRAPTTRPRSRRSSPTGPAPVDGPARRGDGRLPGRRRRGLRLRQLDPRRGPARRLRPGVRLPRLRAGLHPAAVLRGQGPVPLGRAVRRPGRHRRHRPGDARPVPGERVAGPLDPDGRRAGRVPGPAGPDLLARLRRAGQGRRCGSTRWSPRRAVRARSSSAATTSTAARSPRPYRETEAMRDGSDAIADWPLLNALVNTASGASWVSIHHGGGVGIGRSIHAGQVVRRRRHRRWPAQKIERVLTNDPGMGVIRHVDAGYERAGRGRRRERGRARPDARRRCVTGERVPRAVGRARADRPRPGDRRLPAATPGPTPELALPRLVPRPGGAPRPDRSTTTATATCGPGGATRTPATPCVTGSHLDSVPHGGAYDGPLGIVCAFLAVDELRARGRRPRPGRSASSPSPRRRAPASAWPASAPGCSPARSTRPRARALRDRDGVDARPRRSGRRRPAGAATRTGWPGSAPSSSCTSSRAGRWSTWTRRSASASAIWPHGRWRLDFAGEANHAGTTRMADRRDPMLTFADTVLAANKEARLRGAHATVGRVAVEPNATNAIPSPGHAAGSTPAPPTPPRWTRWSPRSAKRARSGPAATAPTVDARPPSRSSAEVALRRRAARPARRRCSAARRSCRPAPGTTPGVLAAHVPTAMLFVRNPTGVSHSPGRARHRRRLRGRRRRRWPTCWRSWRAA